MAIQLFENKNECCGCTACMNICPQKAIRMEKDEEGFLYPVVDKEKCIECGLCKKVCAFQKGYNVEGSLKKVEVYATKNKSDEIRMHSSSGGMFYTISKYVLSKGGLVYGVIFDNNFHAVHIRTDSIDGIKKMMGSKYSQSELGNIYNDVKKDLKDGKLVLFTGTPCQVGGLNKFLQNIDKTNLILVDLVCHGTPSPYLFQDYIKFIEKNKKKKIIGYYHRSKKIAWQQHTENIVYEDGKEDYTSRLSQTWKRLFGTTLFFRPSCYSCKYTNTIRTGDITIGDFWGIEKYNKEFTDNKGVSLTLVNTIKGQKVFDEISKDLIINNRKIEEAIVKNPQLKQPINIDIDERNKFWNDYKTKGFKYIASKYGGYNNIGKLKNLVKRIIKK